MAELEDAQMTGVSLCAELGDLYESRLTVGERSGRKYSAGRMLALWNAGRTA
jgi:hypothetical protein